MSQPNVITYHPNLQAALDLAKAGIRVFPVTPDKRPLVKWKTEATTDPAKIRRWWRRWPDAMPAFATGDESGIDVLDLDRKDGKDGFKALAALGIDPADLSWVAARFGTGSPLIGLLKPCRNCPLRLKLPHGIETMRKPLPTIRVKYVAEDNDRHGNVRLYLRKPGLAKTRLPGPLGSPEFWAAYHKALAAAPAPVRHAGPLPGSIRRLVAEYYKTPEFKRLDAKTRRVRMAAFERFCAYVPDGGTVPDGDRAFAEMRAKHVRARRDLLDKTPGTANNLVKFLRVLFAFAIRYDHHDRNPAADVELMPGSAEGWHSWTLAEIEQFESKYPAGTTPRLVLALALYTGQRRADLAVMGRQQEREGWLRFTQNKGRNKSPVRLQIPIIPELRRILDASPTGDLIYITGATGQPLKPNSLGNSFRDWCNAAGLPNCSLHGLRKAAASRLAELGCSEFQIMSITGRMTSKEVTRYTRAASQRTRAEGALARITGEHTADKSVPLFEASAESGTNLPTNDLKLNTTKS